MNIVEINNGITAPKGFLSSGIHCGVKEGYEKKDLGLIYSKIKCTAAGVYTSNKVKGAPILVCKKHLQDNKAQAVIVNSGNANTCNGDDGFLKAEKMTEAAACGLKINKEDVLVASTGVIGLPLNIEAIEKGIPSLVDSLSENGSDDTANAIMTTDTVKKEIAVQFKLSGKDVTIGSISKGSGMIEPNMCTMLSFITTDVNIKDELLKEALTEAVNVSYNRVSVDGDMSTNDTILILANGLAENDIIDSKNEDYYSFLEALKYVTVKLSKQVAKDGEGATKLIQCTMSGARTEDDALILSKSVINSSLVKAAMFGCDANWGRILCAMGYSKAFFDPEKVNVYFESKQGSIIVCKDGASVNFNEDDALKILKEDEITIKVELNIGDAEITTWGCDLTYDYVKINGDYRS
ncbi:glutamate N-acetyltransferase [Clostridium sp. DSM 8431]|uniref:bifunctional glutamate N-acetyltransferase/amino-acid acetyltransferase ArgJ n=1 Tax=Clostridium sp. DSM 8431 TaxID=1761781 RepID=UPI0008EB929A|nr:bifunctional glutamate N-acetyltransferase/amino-acid acetyltransferase ArgJ [Clostridium sp. DSM 8431]SFU57661.1 glutamate N-acetyltransferase [Clostridium sp. DSM 8431]